MRLVAPPSRRLSWGRLAPTAELCSGPIAKSDEYRGRRRPKVEQALEACNRLGASAIAARGDVEERRFSAALSVPN